jgi:hypothetical protein
MPNFNKIKISTIHVLNQKPSIPSITNDLILTFIVVAKMLKVL